MSRADHDKERGGKRSRRRGAIRTALILAAVVLVIYLTFVARGILNFMN